jgi:hypothetical protein
MGGEKNFSSFSENSVHFFYYEMRFIDVLQNLSTYNIIKTAIFDRDLFCIRYVIDRSVIVEDVLAVVAAFIEISFIGEFSCADIQDLLIFFIAFFCGPEYKSIDVI